VTPVWLQGGEDCATAVVIGPSIPISVRGTTEPYQNDLDEQCEAHSIPGGRDVVYKLIPDQNYVVDMTFCIDYTDFDTKLYVYDGACVHGNYIACDDEDCAAPGYYTGPWQSTVRDVQLQFGHT